MRDADWSEAQTQFGLQLAIDLMAALVLTGVIPRDDAKLLVNDTTNHVSKHSPDLADKFREIRMTLLGLLDTVGRDV